MRPEDILNNAIESIKSGIDKVDDTYESHIREKAIKEVNKKIEPKRTYYCNNFKITIKIYKKSE